MTNTNYTLNQVGQRYVDSFIKEKGKEGLNLEPFYREAEDAANDAFHRELLAVIELGSQYSYDKRPHLLTLDEQWFDAECIS